MQINSVNNQNSFGIKFSPRFKNALRELATEVFSKDGDGCYKFTPRVRDIFEKRVQKLKEMMPDAKLDLVDTWVHEDATIFGINSQANWLYNPVVADVPTFSPSIVLKRKGMADKTIGSDYELITHLGVHGLIKSLQRIEKEEQAPILKAAIERTKKLLP